MLWQHFRGFRGVRQVGLVTRLISLTPDPQELVSRSTNCSTKRPVRMENIPVGRPEAMEVAAIILTMYHGGLE